MSQVHNQREQTGGKFFLPRVEQKDGCPPCWKVLDRFHWTAGLAFDSHGARLGIRVNDAALMEHLPDYLPPGWQPAASPIVDGLYSLAVVENRSRLTKGHQYFLYRGSCRIARSPHGAEILQRLESDLHLQVATEARERLFVHAGVAAWNGKAIVIPGRTFSGKTSLVAALIRAGAVYFSDEYAVFDDTGCVHPYAKSLSIRDEHGKTVGKFSAETFGGQAATEPLPVGLIVSTHYEAGAPWRPRAISPGRALLALLDNTVQVRAQPQIALATLQKAALSAAAFKSKRGEADRTAAWLLEHM